MDHKGFKLYLPFKFFISVWVSEQFHEKEVNLCVQMMISSFKSVPVETEVLESHDPNNFIQCDEMCTHCYTFEMHKSQSAYPTLV